MTVRGVEVAERVAVSEADINPSTARVGCRACIVPGQGEPSRNSKKSKAGVEVAGRSERTRRRWVRVVVKDTSRKKGRIMQRAQEGGTGVNKQRTSVRL
jgi:hypothetical protein